ncbi:fructose-2,6-bisphosphatase TIGAR B [Engraulis encrasicolus]|uniref:fructose-2,6-bisphosphatase TIGAR B n=1 Tax=Engraulis encrasicolus TaxID=184585 RepID=UPI002FCFD9FD
MLTFAVTFIRHGETEFNKQKMLQGQGIDSALSDIGLQQGREAGEYLREVHFHKAYSSNMQRAKQTAQVILSSNVHSSGIELLLDDSLKERSFGVVEGKHKDMLKNLANAAGIAARDFTPPGGETADEVRVRFRKFLARLFQDMVAQYGYPEAPASASADPTAATVQHDGPPINLPDDGLSGVPLHVLVVSHGAYIRVAVQHLVDDLHSTVPAGLKPAQLYAACPNTGINRFVISLQGGETGPTVAGVRCIFVNRKDHLSASKET